MASKPSEVFPGICCQLTMKVECFFRSNGPKPKSDRNKDRFGIHISSQRQKRSSKPSVAPPPPSGWPLSRTTDVPPSGSMEVKVNRERMPDIWISPSIEHPGGAHCRRFHASLSRRERKDGRRQRIGILTSGTRFTLP